MILFIIGLIIYSILCQIFGTKAVTGAAIAYAIVTKDEKLLTRATAVLALTKDEPTSDSASAAPAPAHQLNTDSKT